MTGRMIDPYAGHEVPEDLDAFDDDLTPLPVRRQPAPVAPPAAPGPTNGDGLELLALVPEALVLRALGVGRRALRAASPSDAKLALELARLRLSLLGPLVAIGAHGDRRALVATLATSGLASAITEQLERAIAAAEKSLPRIERASAARREPAR